MIWLVGQLPTTVDIAQHANSQRTTLKPRKEQQLTTLATSVSWMNQPFHTDLITSLKCADGKANARLVGTGFRWNERKTMNKEILKGKWLQVKGDIRTRWGKLTDDEVDQIQGDAEKFLGMLQERYGYRREQAEKELNEFLRMTDDQRKRTA
jgi:uncharacterized protein YjbJ (UPF0337 family)